VASNIDEALNEGFMTALIILDLSATFGIIDHPILFRRLELSFGNQGKGLNLD